MPELWKNYEIVRYSTQLIDVRLFSLSCAFKETQDESPPLSVNLSNHYEFSAVTENDIDIFLNVTLDGPFSMNVIYQGMCRIQEDQEFDKEQFAESVQDLIVPFLLPYARECIANTLARMQLPIYTMPTIDILQTLLANHQESGE
ncbi:hypothetical protein [Cohnella yongneupensis]|uniref:Preprotein translocase subunit SecB n=1 Tax=Cohnella yongneupensis TaxID=425006 RepID=A0ABW0R0C2_9BACL